MGSLVRAIVVALGCLALVAGASHANSASLPTTHAAEFDKTLPPVGFVRFCASNPGECRSVGRRAEPAKMNTKRWTYLYQVNTYVNTRITPMSDQELYGQSEYWTYPTTAGDCEDYLLLKKRELEKLGFDSGSLLITVVLDEKGEGHAVLTVVTEAGDYVLDNRRNDVLIWSDTGYTFLKRQSPRDPRQWVALTEQPVKVLRSVAGN